MLVDGLAVRLHQRRLRRPEAHAVAVIVRPDLKVKRGPPRPVLAAGADAEPQVVLVRSIPVQPSGIPIDAGELQQKRLLGECRVQGFIHLLAQRTGGGQEMCLIVLLMRQKPGAFVVEPNAPQKVQCLLCIAFKSHAMYSS